MQRCNHTGTRHPSALPTAQLWLHLFSFAAASLAAGLCSTVHVLDLWFQHGLARGCPKLHSATMVVARELFFVHLSKSLTHISWVNHYVVLLVVQPHHLHLPDWRAGNSTPEKGDLSHPPHRELGNKKKTPKCLWSPQSQGAEARTTLGAREPSSTPPSPQAEQQRLGGGRSPGISRSPVPKTLEADPSPPWRQQRWGRSMLGHAAAMEEMCKCRTLLSPGSRSHSLLWGDREPARRW